MPYQSGKVPLEAIGGTYGPYDGYDPADNTVRWPHNFQQLDFGDGAYHPAWFAVQKSKNTMAVYTLSLVGLQNAFNQLTEKLHFDLDPVNDLSYSPLALGQFTEGVTLMSLAAAYGMIGNGGLYYHPYLYSKVVDQDGRIVLSQNVVGERVISSDTAYITSRMMKKVVDDPEGSGWYASLGDIEVVGKTGTANDESTYTFVGVTPEYVACYRLSRDNHQAISRSAGWRAIPQVWGDIMKVLTEGDPAQSFEKDRNVVILDYCTETGFIAGENCTKTEQGYYRKSNYPKICDGDQDHDKKYFEEHYGVPDIPLYN